MLFPRICWLIHSFGMGERGAPGEQKDIRCFFLAFVPEKRKRELMWRRMGDF